jgi:chromosome segregation ATPase
MAAVAALGEEERRSVSAADVTEQYVDLETRLRNNLALRNRLQQLLSRASDVEDVLAIEKELNRIQSEIETMQARLDRLKSAVELSALSVNLQRKHILGPLGYVGYGLWWAFSKLFVFR